MWAVLVASICPMAAHAQNEPPPVPSAATPTIGEFLDEALTKIHVAESGGSDAQTAFQRARQIVDAVLSRDPLNRRAAYYRGRLMILADRGREALSAIERWVESPEGQNDWEAHLLQGRLYGAGGFHKLAKPSLLKAQTLNPTEPAVLIELARCEMNLLNYGAAAERMTEAIGLLGRNASSAEQTLLAQILSKDGKLAQADQQAAAAVQKARTEVREAPGDAEMLRRLGNALDVAREIKRSGVEQSPDVVQDCLEISRLIQERAEVANRLNALEALSWSIRGLEAGKESSPPELYVDAAQLLRRLNRDGEARAIVAQLLAVHPDHTEARRLLDELGPPPADESAPDKPSELP